MKRILVMLSAMMILAVGCFAMGISPPMTNLTYDKIENAGVVCVAQKTQKTKVASIVAQISITHKDTLLYSYDEFEDAGTINGIGRQYGRDSMQVALAIVSQPRGESGV